MTTEAWLLHKQPVHEKSARLTLFTLNYGLIHCLYKGYLTLKKQSLVQPFVPLNAIIQARYHRYYISSLENLAPSFTFSKQSLFSALYLNELLYHFLKEGEPNAQLFEIYKKTIHKLAHTKTLLEVEGLLREFEWVLIQTSGYAPSYLHDAETLQSLVENQWYDFIPDKGFIAAPTGILGRDIKKMAAHTFPLTETTVLKAAKFIMRKAIDYLLEGKPLKSRELFFAYTHQSKSNGNSSND